MCVRLSKDFTGPLTQLLDRRTAGCVMALIHCRQQADILLGVLLFKAGHGPLTALDLTRLAVLGNQSGELLTGVTTDLHLVADHHPFRLISYWTRPLLDKLLIYMKNRETIFFRQNIT